MGSQKCYITQIKDQQFTIDISDLSNTTYITVCGACGGNYLNERHTVSTVKTWTSISQHYMNIYAYGHIYLYYSNGKLVVRGDGSVTVEFSLIIND